MYKTFSHAKYKKILAESRFTGEVPGIQYSLSMDREADYTVLWFLAEQLFQPVQ
jgi:hypothetical protein